MAKAKAAKKQADSPKQSKKRDSILSPNLSKKRHSILGFAPKPAEPNKESKNKNKNKNKAAQITVRAQITQVRPYM